MSSNEVANHLPGSDVKSALRPGSHGERNRALRAKADSPGPGLLAWPHAYGLREHIDGDGRMSGFEFLITAQTK